jgi:deoxyribodipyrimidine photo-lyase
LITGGERLAQEHLAQYFAGDLPLSYKAVRNELDGFNNSSKMSPWLNMGCLSVRRLRWTVENYESKHGENESTYWLFIELLWREYFLWLALQIKSQLFSFQGAAARPPMTKFEQDKFESWCKGDTPYPLVNACMRQLNRSGFLSNRGRQIAASCLVNELAQDWRYGAAFFEQQLVDYNVAVNWGNWQYIAGVGADPRGGRHFNLNKQTELYDGSGEYRRRWEHS